MEEEKESLGGHPDGLQEGTSRDSQHCERAEMMIVRLASKGAAFWPQKVRGLFDKIRYFFFITNRFDYTAEQIVSLANGRCNQENVIEQLKNGVNLMRMPVDDLLSNWACMVITSLAWNLKAWFGLLLSNSQQGLDLVKMEFRGFLHAILLLPAQIVHTGRRVVYRIMAITSGLKISSRRGSICVGSVPLSKQNDLEPNLCQQEAYYVPGTATIRSSARTER